MRRCPKRCDVAIVGAGYAGLSAALTLARAGRSVVVLEADAPGYGASSRSGGMIGHGHRLSYTKLIDRYGAQKAKALVREGMASLQFLKDLIDGEKIDAALQLCGRVRGAWTQADYDTMARDADALRRDVDMPIDVLSKADIRNEVATDLYQGGLLFRAHGGVHPGAVAAGPAGESARRRARWSLGYTPVTGVAARREGIRGRDAARSRRRCASRRDDQRLHRDARRPRSRAVSSRSRAFSSRPRTWASIACER